MEIIKNRIGSFRVKELEYESEDEIEGNIIPYLMSNPDKRVRFHYVDSEGDVEVYFYLLDKQPEIVDGLYAKYAEYGDNPDINPILNIYDDVHILELVSSANATSKVMTSKQLAEKFLSEKEKVKKPLYITICGINDEEECIMTYPMFNLDHYCKIESDKNDVITILSDTFLNL